MDGAWPSLKSLPTKPSCVQRPQGRLRSHFESREYTAAGDYKSLTMRLDVWQFRHDCVVRLRRRFR